MVRKILSALCTNPFERRKPASIEIFFQIVFALLLAGLLYDFFEAYQSLGCRDPIQPGSVGCYPWGGTEGPIDGAWNYMSREIYLRSGALSIFTIFIILISPFFTRTLWYPPIAVVFVYLFNTHAAEWVAGLF